MRDFVGDDCEINFDECASNPCGHGICIDDVNSYTCACKGAYSGVNCEVELNPCLPNRCLNEARCVPKNNYNNFTCVCKSGFTGEWSDHRFGFESTMSHNFYKSSVTSGTKSSYVAFTQASRLPKCFSLLCKTTKSALPVSWVTKNYFDVGSCLSMSLFVIDLAK